MQISDGVSKSILLYNYIFYRHLILAIFALPMIAKITSFKYISTGK